MLDAAPAFEPASSRLARPRSGCYGPALPGETPLAAFANLIEADPLNAAHSPFAAERGPFAGTEDHLDAPYRPTPMPIVERMLDLAGVGPGVRLLDLGCGDGRIVIAAAKRGALATGIDIDPQRIVQAEAAARAAAVADRARFEQGDMFAADLSGVAVVTLFLLAHVNRWLETKLQSELGAGARVLSYSFPMPNWVPAAQEEHDRCSIYMWVV